MSGFQKRIRLNCIVMLFVIHGCWVSKAVSHSCPVSPSTVQIVDDCPDSEDKWRQATARKNCSAYASQCDEPKRLVYHCVINAFVNQTLEVCAYSRIIVLGFCTEYSFGGNIIQQNSRTNCTTFTQNPCPLGYSSTDSYKYPDCYKLTKKLTTGPAAKTTPSTIKATDMNGEKEGDEGSSKDILLTSMITLIVILVVTIAVLVVIICMCRKGKCPSREEDHKIPEIIPVKSPLLIVKPTMDTETGSENKHIAPSGQTIGNGKKTREIKTFEEEMLPVHFLKQEKDPEQDCQALLFDISDKLAELAKKHSKNSNVDIQHKLTKLRNEYYDKEIPFSLESNHSLRDDLEYLESIIEMYKN